MFDFVANRDLEISVITILNYMNHKTIIQYKEEPFGIGVFLKCVTGIIEGFIILMLKS